MEYDYDQFGFKTTESTPISYNVPKYNWKVKLTDNTWLMQTTAPNWFHRKMCGLILGVKWIKL